MKLGWVSDIHLDCLNDDLAVDAFLEDVASRNADAWLIGGDIAEASSVVAYLQRFELATRGTVYFVLGNHDFYGRSIEAVQRQIRSALSRSTRLVWLSDAEVQHVDGGLVIVGDDGWADARLGDARGTPVLLKDFFLIRELAGLSRPSLIHAMTALGDAAAQRLEPKLCRAAESSDRVVVLTHVPPFREAAWYDGRMSSDEFLPWFSSRAMGEVILACAAAHPAVRFLVLCGHTHGPGTCEPARNVIVHTAGAEYGAPRVQAVFDFTEGAWPSAPVSQGG